MDILQFDNQDQIAEKAINNQLRDMITRSYQLATLRLLILRLLRVGCKENPAVPVPSLLRVSRSHDGRLNGHERAEGGSK